MRVVEPNIGRATVPLTSNLNKSIRMLSEAFTNLFKKYIHFAFVKTGECHSHLAVILYVQSSVNLRANGVETQSFYSDFYTVSGIDSRDNKGIWWERIKNQYKL